MPCYLLSLQKIDTFCLGKGFFVARTNPTSWYPRHQPQKLFNLPPIVLPDTLSLISPLIICQSVADYALISVAWVVGVPEVVVGGCRGCWLSMSGLGVWHWEEGVVGWRVGYSRRRKLVQGVVLEGWRNLRLLRSCLVPSFPFPAFLAAPFY